MIKLTEKERGYIEDCLECMGELGKTYIERSQQARELYNTKEKSFQKADRRRQEVISFEQKELDLSKALADAFKVPALHECFNHEIDYLDMEMDLLGGQIFLYDGNIEILNGYIAELLESYSGKVTEGAFMLDFENFSGCLDELVSIQKEDKEKYGGKKIKSGFLILHFIERNIVKGILDKNNCSLILKEELDVGNLGAVDFCVTEYRVKEMTQDEYDRLLDTNLTPELKFVKSHRSIKEHYFDKRDTFTREDINYVIEALKDLDVCEEVLGRVKSYLNKEFDGRKRISVSISKMESNARSWNEIQTDLLKYYDLDKKEITATSYITSEEVICCVMLLNELKVNKGDIETFMGKVNMFNRRKIKDLSRIHFTDDEEIIQELSKYYDTFNNQIVANRYLSKEEIIKCIFMLGYLKFSKEDKEKFLKAAKDFNDVKGHDSLEVNKDEIYPVQVFEDLYEKIEYYSNYFGFSKEFEEGLKSTYELCLVTELNALKDCTDYYNYQNVLSGELDAILKYMRPDNMVEYEIKSAEKRGSKLNVRRKKK